jgi:hypothetical protein
LGIANGKQDIRFIDPLHPQQSRGPYRQSDQQVALTNDAALSVAAQAVRLAEVGVT